MNPEGPFLTRFRSGPPLHAPGLGWLPGPPHSLAPISDPATLYIVDDAHCGEIIHHGPRTLFLISTGQALRWLAHEHGLSKNNPPSPQAVPAPTSISTVQAATLLGISRWSLDNVRSQAPGNLPHAPYPSGAGKRKTHWRYPADPDLLRAWWATASHAVRTATQTTVLQREPLKPPNCPPNRHPNTAPAREKRRTTPDTPPRSLLTLLKDRR